MSTNTFLKLGDIEANRPSAALRRDGTHQFHQRVSSADLADPQQYWPHHGQAAIR
ncbi:MAG: hypothetical protein ACLSHC_13290 [Bilophila wadsworthia]